MSFSTPGKKSADFDFANQLHAIPIKNHKVKILNSANSQNLVMAVELKYEGIKRIAAGLLSPKREKKYELNGLSLEIYNQLDGKKNVEDLIEDLMEKFKLSFFEARALIVQYLKTLMSKGLVVVAEVEHKKR